MICILVDFTPEEQNKKRPSVLEASHSSTDNNDTQPVMWRRNPPDVCVTIRCVCMSHSHKVK